MKLAANLAKLHMNCPELVNYLGKHLKIPSFPTSGPLIIEGRGVSESHLSTIGPDSEGFLDECLQVLEVGDGLRGGGS
jgi:hypothetical protein